MKIFNLGMSKTGTTSFHSLMEELYLTSTHDISISEHTVDELKKEFTLKDCYSFILHFLTLSIFLQSEMNMIG